MCIVQQYMEEGGLNTASHTLLRTTNAEHVQCHTNRAAWLHEWSPGPSCFTLTHSQCNWESLILTVCKKDLRSRNSIEHLHNYKGSELTNSFSLPLGLLLSIGKHRLQKHPTGWSDCQARFRFTHLAFWELFERLAPCTLMLHTVCLVWFAYHRYSW